MFIHNREFVCAFGKHWPNYPYGIYNNMQRVVTANIDKKN